MVVRATLWTILLLLLAHPLTTEAAVSAQLSQQTIDELETVRLTIRASQTRQTQTLDLSALETDFHVMGTNTSSQYRFVNGREQSWVDYQITLQPKRTGDLVIPRITVGPDQTPTITLRVQPLTEETRDIIDKLVFFEQEISAQEVYVQSQLVLDRRLLYSNGVQLYSDLPGAPEIPDAVVVALGEPVSANTERNGQRYGVVEQRYAIFPELSGSLTIPAISVTASVRLIDAGRVSRKGVRVDTQPVQVSVLPVPPEYPSDQPWLPAKDVQLHQVLTPEQSNFDVGDTIKHELLIFIEGNLGSTAPPIALTLKPDEFRTYPQTPVIDDEAQKHAVIGSRLQTASILPLVPGQLHIPAVQITWWDTQAKQVRTSKWQAQQIAVRGTPMVTTTPKQQPDNPTPKPENKPTEEISQPLVFKDLLPGLLSLGGLLIVGVMVIAWRRSGLKLFSAKSSSKIELKALLKTLAAADAQSIYAALSGLVAHHYKLPAHKAIEKFCQRDQDTHGLVRELQAAIYAVPVRSLSETTLSEIRVAANTLVNASRTKVTGELPPLYPHQNPYQDPYKVKA